MISKALIFDSSTIITLALNNMINILEPLKKSFNGEFLITPYVKKEIIDNYTNTACRQLYNYIIKLPIIN